MSYILEALRKSERERQLAQAPTLPSVLDNPHPSRPGWLPWLLVLVLGIVCAVLFWLWLGAADKSPPRALGGDADGQPGIPVQTVTPARTDEPKKSADPGAPPPAPSVQVEARTDFGKPVKPTAPSLRSVVTEDAPRKPTRVQPVPNPIAKSRPNPEADAGSHAVAAQSAGEKQLRPAETAAPQDSAGLPETDETLSPLPDGQAGESADDPPPHSVWSETPPRGLSELKINVLAYSSSPEERFAIINMVKYGKGDRLPGGAVLAEIQADGVVLELRGSRFRLSHR
ncbi:general secretion pathway protein GspB [Methylococcus sp. EFPC2]|uniref:general secretion pathway protein GspB n=1 Tax=Methylococcus sp. EFPC2 TaxID=2812648 RepID=UPI0019671E98|nr:general secretion pathway protein GspB [Methylococcus sp. EFPC2]QSA96906.1 general secretion pathway protein GspB [Methylococcus sp. EFPC2]